MKVKFEKGSKEWLMFMDFWKLCQKYYKPEMSDCYWDSMIDEVENFWRTYKEFLLAEYLSNALLSFFDAKARKEREDGE